MILLLILFLSTAQVWGQNSKRDTVEHPIYRSSATSIHELKSFTILDVDRYLRECYADSEIVVTPQERESLHFKNMGAAIVYIGYSGRGDWFSIHINHREPTFNDFKKWLRKR